MLNMHKIMQDLTVVQDINTQLKKVEENYKAEFTAAEQKLKDERAQIERQKTLIAPKAYSDKQIEFNKKAAAYRLDVQDKTRQLQQSRIAALNEVRSQMEPIVQKLMGDYGATLVFDVNEILFAEKPLDLTEEVVVELNKTLKKIKVKIVPLKKS
ncbi:MAG: OmpH family outer membrane protein [Sneathiella sp.]|nr:OmpH family outer membrane protein [Sneathiella sp.]